MDEKKLILFPILSGLALIAILLAFLAPVYLLGGDITLIIGLFCFYVAAYFVVIFFNSALVYAVGQKIDGKSVSIMGSISFALSRLPSILGWAFIAATVGLILSILDSIAREQKGIGAIIARIIISIIGMGWALATYFVVPIIVFEGTGPLSAIRRSIDLIKKSWGEQAIGSIGIGGAFFILYLIGIIAIGISFFVLPVTMIIIIPLVICYFGVLFILQGALQGIFVTELYRYSATGQAVVFKDEIEAIRSKIKGPSQQVK